ncbi:response regulator transcription factor [Solirhodobacter olei]|uniref:response regulator transcription factor n=1 Tax=Solirhodobacter olei TaxID=2493082 RepID=UPI000FD807FC|nr:response regulator [Solirhodobacter olei]
MAKHVLLVEDEPNIAEAMRYILARDGWRVSTHTDGTDAAQVIRASAPDVVVLDVMLPGRSGYDILQELRAGETTRRLPVLMLTARSQARDRELAERYGASDFLTKPFSNTEVLASVRALAGL